MTGPGTKLRQRYLVRMQKVAIGAKLERNGREWLVMQQQRTETGVVLQLRCKHHNLRLYVGVTMDGPELWHSGLRSVGLPPSQREMFTGGAA